MSAEANLAGLYPPRGQDMFNPNISWQPIPVHTVPESGEKVSSSQRRIDYSSSVVSKNICYTLDSDCLVLLLGPTLQSFPYFQEKMRKFRG